MKKTFLYSVTADDLDNSIYFYGRNLKSVKDFCLNNYSYHNLKFLKIGESKITINENVVPFTVEETEQMEKYIQQKAFQFLKDKAIASGQMVKSDDRKAFGFDTIKRKA